MPLEDRSEDPVALVVGPPHGEAKNLAATLAARDSIAIGVCATPREALASLGPAVRLIAVSLDMPGAEGLIRDLRRRAPWIEIVALTGETLLRPLADFIANALRARVDGPADISDRETQ